MGKNDPARAFSTQGYARHNARRLEHLASLHLPVAGLSVLEVGAGIGDHTTYFLDRGCKVTTTEARAESVELLRQRFPGVDVQALGLLYHLGKPAEAIAFMAKNCTRHLFLETWGSFGDEKAEHLVEEVQRNPTQSFSGKGCRPTRPWLFAELKKHFEFVYCPTTQPNHPEFPLDWTDRAKHPSPYTRMVFIASRVPIKSELLSPTLVARQVRHE
ncbi:MAG: class I SAM-dependent methyltransferase [Verrucomicrobia bacterium]|nr:class I SAM-dependent methyltransferase [Verrucomicrobiota bacterium]